MRSCQQLLKDQCQAKLVCAGMDTRIAQLGRSIARDRLARRHPQEVCQSEFGDLQTVVIEDQVSRVQPQVLQGMLLVEVIDRLGDGAKVTQELRPRNSQQFLAVALGEAIS